MRIKKGFLYQFLPALALLILAAFSMGIKNPADKPADGKSTRNSISRDENAGSKSPDILFCIADDATFRHMSAYGCNMLDYGFEIEYFDKQLEKILALLEKTMNLKIR